DTGAKNEADEKSGEDAAHQKPPMTWRTTKTVMAVVPMKVSVARMERGDSRAMPQTTWPDVQPEPKWTPAPTSSPPATSQGAAGGDRRARPRPPWADVQPEPKWTPAPTMSPPATSQGADVGLSKGGMYPVSGTIRTGAAIAPARKAGRQVQSDASGGMTPATM